MARTLNNKEVAEQAENASSILQNHFRSQHADLSKSDEFTHANTVLNLCGTIWLKQEHVENLLVEIEKLEDAARNFLCVFRAQRAFEEGDHAEAHKDLTRQLGEAETKLSELLGEGEEIE